MKYELSLCFHTDIVVYCFYNRYLRKKPFSHSDFSAVDFISWPAFFIENMDIYV
ncbi:MAG: hypothetical protein JW982_12225 [Spirochaetes bacterium]|nr:hypothetical protein [Spirochaetota bacterium]